MKSGQPLVSILTPVYNGEAFLARCIESVLAQDYSNWEYHIVNNCSTDGTLQMAESYAAKDGRIHVTTNKTFVNVAENHNNAFRLVSPHSAYFKVVSADDWIEPTCLSKMVAFAVENPSVGVLCCHQQSGSKVRWRELGNSEVIMPGREACRLSLLKGMQLFGAPTGFLYRADLLRLGKEFFPNNRPHADSSACYEVLGHCDYGVVPEILATERVHEEQVSSKIERLGAGDLAYLEVVLEYGPRYLSEAEFVARREAVFRDYYRWLGGCLLKLKGPTYWRHHKSRLAEMGCQLSWSRILRGAVQEVFAEARNPVKALRKLGAVLRGMPTDS